MKSALSSGLGSCCSAGVRIPVMAAEQPTETTFQATMTLYSTSQKWRELPLLFLPEVAGILRSSSSPSSYWRRRGLLDSSMEPYLKEQ